MRKILIIITILLSVKLFSQDITNTLGTNGIFSVKDGVNTFFSLNQSNGSISLQAPLSGNLSGSFFKGSERFLHTYKGTGTTGNNTFLGINSGNFTLGGSFSQASHNTAVGYSSLSSLTTGSRNSAFGNLSLYSNTTGYENSAFGYSSLISNTTGYSNSAFGYTSLNNNTTGYLNSAFGKSSLFFNTTGNNNCAFGFLSLYNNNTGNNNSSFGVSSLELNVSGEGNSAFGQHSLKLNTIGHGNSAFGMYSLFLNDDGLQNTGIGINSLFRNVSGDFNSALGSDALYWNTSGNENIAIGYFSGFNIETGSNNIAIGSNSSVPNGNANNQIRIGNSNVTYAGIQVAWTVTSDINLKERINDSKLGLHFISKLRPVSYIRKNDESGKTEYGLIAQEVEKVLIEEGINDAGMLSITQNGEYQLRYNDLIAPLIRSVQELNEKVELLTSENNKLLLILSKYEQSQDLLINKFSEIEKKELQQVNK